MYTPDGHGRAIVAGSAFAQGRHPAWTYNLLAHPQATISVGGRRMPVRATLIGDDERDATWALIETQWPGYRAYERDVRPRGAAVPAAAGGRASEKGVSSALSTGIWSIFDQSGEKNAIVSA